MAATRAQAEASNSRPATATDTHVEPSSASASASAASVVAPAPSVTVSMARTVSTTEGPTPARRTTTRTRKIPSRLLPSPSPPPSRPSSYHNPSKAGKGGKDAGNGVPPTPIASPNGGNGPAKTRKASRNSTASAAASSPSPDPAAQKADGQKPSGSALADTEDEAASETLGLGKRKRRPSSMYKPPSTLTASEAAPFTPNASGKVKKRHEGSTVENGDSERRAQEQASRHWVAGGANTKGRGRTSKGHPDKRVSLPAVPERCAHESDGGFDGMTMDQSDAEFEGVEAVHAIGSDQRGLAGLVAPDDSLADLPGSELSPPPLLPRCGSARVRIPAELTRPITFTKGGRVTVSPETTSRRTGFGLQGFDGQLGSSWKRPEVFGPLTKANANSTREKVENKIGGCGDAAQQPPWRMHEESLGARAAYGSVRPECFQAGWPPGSLSPAHVRAVSDAGSDVEDDEEDFHQAMLDGDFDMFDSQKSQSASNPTWDSLTHKGDASYTDDTPATTPRSPLSHCDVSAPDSPGSAKDDGAARCDQQGAASGNGSLATHNDPASFASIRDAVFAHALPTTLVGADKPHQHAGSLTLSLPYSPDAVVASPKLRNSQAEAPLRVVADRPGSNSDPFTTPIVSRRLHVPGSEPKVVSLPMTMKFSGMGDEASTTTQFLQLSPGIDMESPLLSPTLGLDLQDKASQPPSPFLMGVTSESALGVPAPMSLSGEDSRKDVAASTVAASVAPQAAAPAVASQPKDSRPLSSTTMGRRTAPNHPPPRHIIFTERSVEPVAPAVNVGAAPSSRIAPPPSLQKETSTSTAATPDRTPDLVYGSGGSTSSEASSRSASPASRTESDVAADAEVENLLFGPPEKLDLRELDQVWGGSAQAEVAGMGVSKVAAAPSIPSAPVAAPLRRAKVTRLHHVDLTPK